MDGCAPLHDGFIGLHLLWRHLIVWLFSIVQFILKCYENSGWLLPSTWDSWKTECGIEWKWCHKSPESEHKQTKQKKNGFTRWDKVIRHFVQMGWYTDGNRIKEARKCILRSGTNHCNPPALLSDNGSGRNRLSLVLRWASFSMAVYRVNLSDCLQFPSESPGIPESTNQIANFSWLIQ